MEKNKEWEEINEQLENRESQIKEKYGFDITKNWLNRIEKQKKIWKIIKVIIVLLIILLIGMWHRDIKTRESMIVMKGVGNFDIEIISNKTGILGNGFYTYKIKNNPEVEIHAFRKGSTIESDINSRFYKYFFEKWEDSQKEKFIINESYKTCKNGLTTKKDWLLEYETYIEVSSYEEMEKATEAIIRFKEYMKKPMLLIKSYIKVNGKMIMPNNTYPQTNDQIRENAKQLYLQAVNEQ